jgi:hypothetical protein
MLTKFLLKECYSNVTIKRFSEQRTAICVLRPKVKSIKSRHSRALSTHCWFLHFDILKLFLKHGTLYAFHYAVRFLSLF